MPYSMTGFARQEIQAPWGTLSCEIRSVNHRYLEPLIRLPELLRSQETHIRGQLRKQLQRGKVEVSLQLSMNPLQQEGLPVNGILLEQLMEASQQVARSAQQRGVPISPLDPLNALQWPGMIEQQGVETAVVEAAAVELVEVTLHLLIQHRQREGQELQQHIEQRLKSIVDSVGQVRQQMPEILLAQKYKLQQRLQELAAELDEDRFAQEVAILVNKADVDEELDRLETHINEVRHILSQTGAIGRRLDFMMQELNREANTLSSKSIHSDTTQAAVSLKVLIEQMREQIQNIE